jgi:hypothetical protein
MLKVGGNLEGYIRAIFVDEYDRALKTLKHF